MSKQILGGQTTKRAESSAGRRRPHKRGASARGNCCRFRPTAASPVGRGRKRSPSLPCDQVRPNLMTGAAHADYHAPHQPARPRLAGRLLSPRRVRAPSAGTKVPDWLDTNQRQLSALRTRLRRGLGVALDLCPIVPVFAEQICGFCYRAAPGPSWPVAFSWPK